MSNPLFQPLRPLSMGLFLNQAHILIIHFQPAKEEITAVQGIFQNGVFHSKTKPEGLKRSYPLKGDLVLSICTRTTALGARGPSDDVVLHGDWS